MFRDILHKIKIFFCDDDIEKINVRDSTVIRNNETHKMYDEILNELGDLATVVSRNYVYGRIKDRKNFLQKRSDASVLYGMLALTHSIHTIKKQTLIRNSRQSRILLLKNLG